MRGLRSQSRSADAATRLIQSSNDISEGHSPRAAAEHERGPRGGGGRGTSCATYAVPHAVGSEGGEAERGLPHTPLSLFVLPLPSSLSRNDL